MPIRVLVTGGAGYIGSHTVKRLAREEFEPVVLDDFRSGHRWAAKWGTLAEGKLEDSGFLQRVFAENQPEAVIHFAADIQVGESVANPAKYFWNNCVNTLRLLDAMREAGVKHIVFSSSAAIYGYPDVVPIPEDHPARPVSPYGESKLFMEKALRWYGAAYGINWVALRYFNACGADPEGDLGERHDPESHLIPLAIAAAQGKREHVEIYGTDYDTPDGTAVRDYIHVTDLASAHIMAVEYLLDGGESRALNLGTGQGRSVREVIDAIAQTSGLRPPCRNAPRREGDPPSLVADPTLARKVLRWEAKHSILDEIIQTAWNWHSSHAADSDRPVF
ncbi:MAG TPA: UDP-glucose 4-epimerase GalE [Terriglobia bacterium]|nr:UDP-glucose 4-epimerase GalE [Terriglobia bacterium]